MTNIEKEIIDTKVKLKELQNKQQEMWSKSEERIIREKQEIDKFCYFYARNNK